MKDSIKTKQQQKVMVGGEQVQVGKHVVPIIPEKEISPKEFIKLLQEAGRAKLWPEIKEG